MIKQKVSFNRDYHDCAEPFTWVSNWFTAVIDEKVFDKVEKILTNFFPGCEFGREDVKYGSELVVRFLTEEDEAHFILLQTSRTFDVEI